MDFKTTFDKLSPILRVIAKKMAGIYNINGSLDEKDLYQEMCIHLWNRLEEKDLGEVNYAYLVKGCKFHILNYIRKKREKASFVSMEEPVNAEGGTLRDIIPSPDESIFERVERDITINEIKKNNVGSDVISLLLKGYTLREIGKKLGISHVMVLKYKKKAVTLWQRKIKNRGYQEAVFSTLTSESST